MCVTRIYASLSENADFFTCVYVRHYQRAEPKTGLPKNLSRSVKFPTAEQGQSRPETDPEAMPRKSALHSVKADSMPARTASQTAHGKPDRKNSDTAQERTAETGNALPVIDR